MRLSLILDTSIPKTNADDDDDSDVGHCCDARTIGCYHFEVSQQREVSGATTREV